MSIRFLVALRRPSSSWVPRCCSLRAVRPLRSRSRRLRPRVKRGSESWRRSWPSSCWTPRPAGRGCSSAGRQGGLGPAPSLGREGQRRPDRGRSPAVEPGPRRVRIAAGAAREARLRADQAAEDARRLPDAQGPDRGQGADAHARHRGAEHAPGSRTGGETRAQVEGVLPAAGKDRTGRERAALLDRRHRVRQVHHPEAPDLRSRDE